MAGGGRGGLAVQDVHAAVVGADPGGERAGGLTVVRGDRGHERSRAQGGQGHGVGHVRVADHRGDRTERLDAVHLGGARVLEGEHRGGEERAGLGVGVAGRALGAAEADLTAGVDQALHRAADLALLVLRGQGAHGGALDARVAQDDLRGQALGEGGGHGLDPILRDDHPADGRALLAGLDRHLLEDGLHERLELGGLRVRVRAEDGGVEGVGLRGEADAALLDVRVLLQGGRGGGGAGERDVVAVVQVVQQVAGGAGDQLDRALGQHAGLEHQLDALLRDVAGGGGRLDHGGHAGDEGRGELLEHAPHGEVEGVDLHGHARDALVDVLADEGAIAGEGLHVAIDDHGGVR